MRRRPVRKGAQPQFDLHLPTDINNEVQVQNKNTDELTTFIIDGDNALESPMITTGTQPSSRECVGRFPAVGLGTAGSTIHRGSLHHHATGAAEVAGQVGKPSIAPSFSSSSTSAGTSSGLVSVLPSSASLPAPLPTMRRGGSGWSKVMPSENGGGALVALGAGAPSTACGYHSVSSGIAVEGGGSSSNSLSYLSTSGTNRSNSVAVHPHPSHHHHHHRQGALPSSGGNSTFIPVGNTTTTTSATICSSSGGGSSGGAAPAPQFFHVRDTNLFVLLDGVSMFYDGKSTYTGSIDSELLQKLGERERMRKLRHHCVDGSSTLQQNHHSPPTHRSGNASLSSGPATTSTSSGSVSAVTTAATPTTASSTRQKHGALPGNTTSTGFSADKIAAGGPVTAATAVLSLPASTTRAIEKDGRRMPMKAAEVSMEEDIEELDPNEFYEKYIRIMNAEVPDSLPASMAREEVRQHGQTIPENTSEAQSDCRRCEDSSSSPQVDTFSVGEVGAGKSTGILANHLCFSASSNGNENNNTENSTLLKFHSGGLTGRSGSFSFSSNSAMMAATAVEKKPAAYLQLFACAAKPPCARAACMTAASMRGTTDRISHAPGKGSGLMLMASPHHLLLPSDSQLRTSGMSKCSSTATTPGPCHSSSSTGGVTVPSRPSLSNATSFDHASQDPSHLSTDYSSSFCGITTTTSGAVTATTDTCSNAIPSSASPLTGNERTEKKETKNGGVGRESLHSSSAAPNSSAKHGGNPGSRKKRETRPGRKNIAIEAIGKKNDSVELDEVTFCCVIGVGAQGTVSMVELNKKFYAMKLIDIDAVMATLNASERHVRKRGLVRELEMIRQQNIIPDPKNVIRMFNAVCSTDDQGKRKLYLLMELMWADLARIGGMMERLSYQETYKITQSTFREFMSGDNRTQEELPRLQKDLKGSCKHVSGRMNYTEPEQWEVKVDGRKTPFPEIVLSLLAADLLQGLKELHEDYHLVHCDLKPMNILLTYDREHFKIADLGCSRPLDPVTNRVKSSSGMDVGTKLYKSPERFKNTLRVLDTKKDGIEKDVKVSCASSSSVGAPTGTGGKEVGEHVGDKKQAVPPVGDFGGKADVWSLGILLLELSAGIHPCTTFKTEYWNYCDHLKLSKMLKPLNWSAGLFDFILRCTFVDESERWSVHQLMKHPFVARYRNVPRRRLATFMQRLEEDSVTIHRRKQREWLEEQIRLSALGDKTNYKRQSYNAWRVFTSFLPREGRPLTDRTVYPELR